MPTPADQARWFAKEVQPCEPILRSYLRGTFPGVRDVDDVVQESYLRLWRIGTAQTVRSARGFLFHIARCVATDLARRERTSPLVGVADLTTLPVADTAADSAEAACVREELALLAAAIETLPPRCREIVVLRKLRRLSQKEIAALLGISELTVQVQVLKGVKRCGAYLAARGLGRARP
ncbi:MAG: RNA polymerase sigma factor [Undibacterium sp.]|nr:RNA polymerase sigma factor [Opitutaceae bacterium]